MRLIIGISGASGAQYGVRALELCQAAGVETHLVISPGGAQTLALETDYKLDDVKALAHTAYNNQNVGASIASGSFKTDGMLIAPCSARTLTGLAYGNVHGLLGRAADVILKERRKLVVMFRETPLHLGHTRAMTALTEMGAIIAPPVPAWYSMPKSIDDIITQSVARNLDILGVDVPDLSRWSGPEAP